MKKAPDSREDQLRRVTASSLDLAVICAHWVSLPLSERAPGRPAEMGTAFHSLVSDGCHDVKLTDHEEYLVQCRFEWWVAEHGRAVLGSTVRQEVAFCLAPDGEASELVTNGHRDYGDALGVCGTLDLLFVDEKVADLKTGQHAPAQDAWQLRFGAIVAGVHAAEFHAVNEHGQVTVDRVEYSADDLAASKARLRVLQRDILSGRTPAVPGEHCNKLYCRARSKCTAYKQEGANEDDDESSEY